MLGYYYYYYLHVIDGWQHQSALLVGKLTGSHCKCWHQASLEGDLALVVLIPDDRDKDPDNNNKLHIHT